jgi:hypothetical protein
MVELFMMSPADEKVEVSTEIVDYMYCRPESSEDRIIILTYAYVSRVY